MHRISADQTARRSSRRRSSRRGAVLLLAALVVAAAVPGLVAGDGAWWASLGGGQPTQRVAAADGLDADLERRFAAARQHAATDGVELRITSGWRSPEEQQRLVDDAIAEHGSASAAYRWVLPPERSAHVAGLAIDVGPAEGAQWLDQHGTAYGLCRVYLNEPWHFEPVVPPRTPCPELHPDAGTALD